MIIELLIILTIFALFIIYLMANESTKDNTAERYGEAVNKFVHIVANEVGDIAQNITEPAEQKNKRLAQESLARRNGELYRFDAYWNREYLNDLLTVDEGFKNTLDTLGIKVEVWEKVSQDMLYIGILRKESRLSFDYSKKNSRDSRYLLLHNPNPHLQSWDYKMVTSALQHFNIPSEEWIEYGDAVVLMYDLMEKDYILKYGVISQIMPMKNNFHLL